MDVDRVAARKTIRLTTRGRKSGQPRNVTIWFVAAGGSRIYVQHASRRPAQWYRNLVAHPEVEVDFGDGPVAGRATPIGDPEKVQEVLRLVRRKYLFAWLIQLLGRKGGALAAEISLDQSMARM